jgi:hypothetical protein
MRAQRIPAASIRTVAAARACTPVAASTIKTIKTT